MPGAGYKYPEITGWIRAVAADFKLVTQIGLQETGILTSASDYHVFLKLGKTRTQALASYLDIVKAALDTGVLPRCHFEDITRADYDGFILPFAAELMKLSEQYGKPVKIRLCDTLGFGVPWPEAALPRSVPKLIHGLRKIGVPPAQLEWHGHNDFHKVLVNATTAWLYGCSAANTAIFGIGERTGNTPLEAMVIEHAQLKGMVPGVNYAAITELADYAHKELGFEIPPNYPLVGQRLQRHPGRHPRRRPAQERGDLQLLRHAASCSSGPIGVAITDKTGAAGIKHWIETHYEIEIPKHDPRVTWIKDKIDAEYAADRISAISDDEMHQWVREAFENHVPPQERSEKSDVDV